MPRKSAAALSVPKAISPKVHAELPGLAPSPDLPAAAVRIFHQILRASAVGAFKPCDVPVLEQLATALAYTRRATRALERDGLIVGGKVNPIAKYLRAQQQTIAMLATRLRITPHSRVSKEKAAGNAADPQPGDGLATLLALENRRAQ